MKKSRTRIKRTVTKKPRRRVRTDPNVKIDFYIKNVTTILNNYIDKSEITSILGYKFKDGSKIFSADHKDLNYEIINIIYYKKILKTIRNSLFYFRIICIYEFPNNNNDYCNHISCINACHDCRFII